MLRCDGVISGAAVLREGLFCAVRLENDKSGYLAVLTVRRLSDTRR